MNTINVDADTLPVDPPEHMKGAWRNVVIGLMSDDVVVKAEAICEAEALRQEEADYWQARGGAA